MLIPEVPERRLSESQIVIDDIRFLLPINPKDVRIAPLFGERSIPVRRPPVEKEDGGAEPFVDLANRWETEFVRVGDALRGESNPGPKVGGVLSRTQRDQLG